MCMVRMLQTALQGSCDRARHVHTHTFSRGEGSPSHALCPKLTHEQDQRQVDVQGQPDVRVVGRLVVAALPRDARVSAVVCRSRIAVAVIRSEAARDGRRASDWRGSKTDQEQKSAEGAPVHHVRSADRGSLLACRWDSMAMRGGGKRLANDVQLKLAPFWPPAPVNHFGPLYL